MKKDKSAESLITTQVGSVLGKKKEAQKNLNDDKGIKDVTNIVSNSDRGLAKGSK